MERKRGFEIVKGYEDKNINLPVRKTKCSAGYDFEAAEDVVIPAFKPGVKPVLVKTGVKAYFGEDEVLIIANRIAGFPVKHYCKEVLIHCLACIIWGLIAYYFCYSLQNIDIWFRALLAIIVVLIGWSYMALFCFKREEMRQLNTLRK